MPKTRSLADLYVRGVEFTIDDGKGPIHLWLQKLNPVGRETAARKADAARARTLAGQHDPESDLYVTVLYEIQTMERLEKIQMLVDNHKSTIVEQVSDEVAGMDEWANEEYLQGLRDAWREGVQQTFINDPNDEEAARINKELLRFISQVESELASRSEEHRMSLKDMSNQELNETVLRLHFDTRGRIIWVQEYSKAELSIATRSCDAVKTGDDWDHSSCTHKAAMTREGVDVLEEPTLLQLSRAVAELTVDPLEGKELPAMPAS